VLSQPVAFAIGLPSKIYPFYRSLANSTDRWHTSFLPKDTVHPVRIFIARASCITELSGTHIKPLLSLDMFWLFSSISSLRMIP